MKKVDLLAGLICSCIHLGASFALCSSPRPLHYSAREIKLEERSADRALFSRPASVRVDGPNLFVLDSADCEVRVFTKAGAFLYAFGRKGKGPGEFDMPSDLDILSNKIYVADAANRRVQILDKKGRHLGGFRVPFFPQRVLAWDEGLIIVAHLPMGLAGQEKMLHGYSPAGDLVWEALDSFYSDDSVYDVMRNEVFLKKGEGTLFIIPRCLGRIILEMTGGGEVTREIEVGEEYPLREVAIPAKGGLRDLPALCWNCDRNDNGFYLLIPDDAPKNDLGPGTRMGLIGEDGRVKAFIDFPAKISRFAAAGDWIYGLDTEYRLRLFRVTGD